MTGPLPALRAALLVEADLSMVDFSGAELPGADLTGVDLDGAILIGTKGLASAKRLDKCRERRSRQSL